MYRLVNLMRVVVLVSLGLLSAAVWAQTDCSLVTEIPQGECENLLTLYNLGNGANWLQNEGWNVNNMPCSWYGVTCSGNSVQQLNLANNNLVRGLAELANLTNLTQLSIDNNPNLCRDVSYLYTGVVAQEAANLAECDRVNLLTPVDKLTDANNELTLTWDTKSGATVYRVVISENRAFSGFVDSLNASACADSTCQTFTTADTQYALSGLKYGQTYYWKVRTNASMVFGWSEVRSFTVKSVCSAVTEIPQEECESLLELYDSTNGENWTNNTGWNETNEPCSWYGVSCNNGSITALNLQNNRLTNVIPNLNLPNLESLILSNNDLSGEVPFFSGLNNLTTAELAGNPNLCENPDKPYFSQWTDTSKWATEGALNEDWNFDTGEYIKHYRPCENYEFSCDYVAMHPVSRGHVYTGSVHECESLVEFYDSTNGDNWKNNGGWKSSNNLCGWTGITCNDIEETITAINLRNNQLTGTITELTNLSDLRHIYLDNNSLTGSIPQFSNLTQLESLTISNNQLIGEIPDSTTSLYKLDLSGNQLTGSIPNFPDFEIIQLTLSGNQLCRSLDRDYGNWSTQANEFELCLSFCEYVTSIPKEECESLVALYDSTDGEKWTNNTGWKKTIEPCSWYGIDCNGGSRVFDITLENNNLNGELPNIDGLSNLYSLNLSNNKIFGELPDFSKFSLYSLNISNNQLIGKLPNFGPTFSINLSNNQLNGGITQFDDSLRILKLNNNQFTGSIPTFNDFLEVLDLSNNQLSGSIPDSFLVENLNLSNNQLSGLIPSLFEYLRKIDLSNNKLTGQIPLLSNLRYLNSADFSGNDVCQSFEDWFFGVFPTCDDPTYGLVLHLPFDNTTDDTTSYNHQGIANNISYIKGIKNQAVYFNGNDAHIKVADTDALDTDESMTIAFWMKPIGLDNQAGDWIISKWCSSDFDCGDDNTPKGDWNIHTGIVGAGESRNDLSFIVQNYPEYQIEPNVKVENAVFRQQWKHIAVTFDAGVQRVYINGKQEAETTKPLPHTSIEEYDTDDIYIGNAWALTAKYAYQGAMDELMIYNRALPADEIKQLYVNAGGFDCATVEGIPETECEALVSLYDSLDGINWTYNNGWKQITNPCGNWYNVACKNGHVSDISLENNSLTGIIPDLSALTELEALPIGNNPGITGDFPDISALTKLYHLSLGNTNISNALPVNLVDNTSLRELGLSETQLGSNLPDFSRLTNLIELNLGNSQFTGTIPALPSGLTLLNLSGNNLCRDPATDYGSYTEVDAFPLCNDPNYSLVLHLSFDENTNDTSAYGHHGTPSNISYVAGKQNQAAYFNGTNAHVKVADTAALDTDSSMTVAFWAKPESLGNSWLISKWCMEQDNFCWPDYEPIGDWGIHTGLTDVGENPGDLKFVSMNHSEYDTLLSYKAVNGFTNDQWQYIVATYDAGVHRVYINGVKTAETETYINGELSTAGTSEGTSVMKRMSTREYITDDIYIGHIWTLNESHGYHGAIDELKIYNRALSDEEVTQLFMDAGGFNCSTVTEIPQEECEALVALYDSTDGDNWKISTGWKETNTPCSWYGIACEEGNVTLVNLINNRISGEIPDFNQLSKLDSLQLYGNNLTGSIPNFNLPELTYMNFYDNQLSGSIPDFNLPKLTSLFLHNNKLTNSIPSFNLPNLTTLIISNNQLCRDINFNYGEWQTQAEEYPTCDDPTYGLVLHLPFDNTTNDTTTYAHHGIANKVSYVEGIKDQAIYFNGIDAYVKVADTDDLDTDNSMTIAFWAKPGALDNTEAGDFLIGKWCASSPHCTPDYTPKGDWVIRTGRPQAPETSDDLLFTIQNYPEYPDEPTFTTLKINEAVYSQQWRHIAATFDHGTMAIYINGQQIQKETTPILRTSLEEYDSDDIYIGHIWNLDEIYAYEGAMDELVIYNRALSEEEITQLFVNSGGSVVTTGCNGDIQLPDNQCDDLVAYYPFNGNANDESGNGNDGIVDGATLSTDRNGNASSAYIFDGANDRIEATNTTEALQLKNSSFTFVTWAYLAEYGGSSDRPLLYKATPEGVQNEISDGYQFWYGWANELFLSTPEKTPFEFVDALEKWRMLTVTYNMNTQMVNLYVDDKLHKEIENISPIQTTPDSPFYIGYSSNYAGSWFKGKIDELFVYNRALTQEEVNNFYQTTKPDLTGCNGAIQLPDNLCQNLVAYYPFSGNANDESGNGNDGVVDGAALGTDRNGNENSAYIFDGIDDKIEATNTTQALLLENSSFSFVTWAYLAEHGVSSDRPLLYKATPTGVYNDISAGYQFLYGWGNDVHLSTPDKVNFNFELANALGKWRMLTVTYDMSTQTVRLYADGNLQKEIVNIPPIPTTPVSPFYIGYSHNYGGSWFKGKVDELFIYNRLLSQAEVQTLYNNTAGNLTNANVLEDAEDNTTQGWSTYQDVAGNSVIANIYDPSIGSQVIEFQGDARSGHVLGDATGAALNETNNFLVNWRAKGEIGKLFWEIQTDSTVKAIEYKTTARLGCHLDDDPQFVYCGIDVSMREDRWRHYARDLQVDLQAAVPDARITNLRYLRVRAGQGARIDDIKLLDANNVTYYTISGQIQQNGSPISGVNFTASGVDCQTSDANGLYQCQVPPNWFGTLVPTKSNYTFTPFTLVYRGLSSNQTEQNFTADTPSTDQPFIHWTRDMHITDDNNGAVQLPDFWTDYIDNAFTVIVKAKTLNKKTNNYLFHADDDYPGIVANDNNQIRFAYSHNGNTQTSQQIGSLTTRPLPTHQWFYASLTWDGNQFVAYINGERSGSIVLPNFIYGQRVLIGGDGSPERTFAGEIAEVKLYRRALNDAEIKAAQYCEHVDSIPKSECEVLIDLYTLTKGSAWFNQGNWLNTDVQPCDWAGITCRNEHIVKIDLNSNQLTGQLPASITTLSKLERLKLHNNYLTNQLNDAATVTFFTNLIELSVHQNCLQINDPTLQTIFTNQDANWATTQQHCKQTYDCETTLAQGQVACYTFDQHLADGSSHIHHGINHGAIDYVPSKMGYALLLNGDSYIEIPHIDALHLNRPLSISLFILPLNQDRVHSNNIRAVPIMLKGIHGPNNYSVWLQGAYGNSSIAYQQYPENYPAQENNVAFTFATPFSEETQANYTHIAIVRDLKEVHIYKNGKLSAVHPADYDAFMTPQSLFIGFDGGYGYPKYKGYIDELRIYDRALSAEDVQFLYLMSDPRVDLQFNKTGVGKIILIDQDNNNQRTSCNEYCPSLAYRPIENTALIIEVAPTPGYAFLGWEGDEYCPPAENKYFKFNALNAMNCTANFSAEEELQTYQLEVRAMHPDSKIKIQGQECSNNPCSRTFQAHDSARIKVTPPAGMRIDAWQSLPGCTSESPKSPWNNVSMSQDIICEIYFEPISSTNEEATSANPIIDKQVAEIFDEGISPDERTVSEIYSMEVINEAMQYVLPIATHIEQFFNPQDPNSWLHSDLIEYTWLSSAPDTQYIKSVTTRATRVIEISFKDENLPNLVLFYDEVAEESWNIVPYQYVAMFNFSAQKWIQQPVE